jgi:hypothetical protein
MSYFRRQPALGDGPITTPSQADNGNGIIVGTVPPTRVDCSQLPADSPYRQPGQVCAPSSSGNLMDLIMGLIPGNGTPSADAGSATATPATVPDSGMSDTSKWMLAGAAAVAAYYYFKKKRRA